MGCSESKIDDKQTTKQCKRSKAYMRQSISAHAAFADAHFAYALALKNTGAALSDYIGVTEDFNRTPENEVWDFFLALMEDVHGPGSAEVGYKGNKIEKRAIRGNVVESEEVPRRSIAKNENLLKVFKEVDDCFINASESAYEVSRILEANKLHHHSNFGDNRGLIDHSTRLVRVITLNKSFRRPKNLNDPKDYFVYTEKETLATILDKMLEWEKKLYKQAKAGEDMKYAYQRKIASLNKLEKRGASNNSLEHAQATVKQLRTKYTVDMQSINSTITEINLLRDEQLYPKLVQLVQEMATMWENMQKQHEHQSTIIHALQNFKASQDEASGHDLIKTQKLHHHVKIWCTEFKKLIQHQNNYIKSLENWLKYNLAITINHNLKPHYPKIEPLLRAWLDELEKLPKEDTITTMDKLAEDIHTIAQLQLNKTKMKEKCDETRKELFKVSQKFERWCNKDIAKKLSSHEIDDIEVIAKQEIVVEALKLRMVVEEETYEKLCVEVKDTMVVNLTTRLPEVLKNVSGFARACLLMYKNLNMKC
ncbi:nitrate regulatory gene2 protein-like protein [Tanacetum coccineum]